MRGLKTQRLLDRNRVRLDRPGPLATFPSVMRTFAHAAKSAPMIDRISTGSPNASTIREAISTARS